MKKRRLKHHFLLLEVVASLGLFAFFAVGLLTPYAKSSANLRQFQRELELRRYAQLAAMELHIPDTLSRFLPTWSSSDSKELRGLIWQWPLAEETAKSLGVDHLLLSMRCDRQTPLRPRMDQGTYPAWRRLITTHWKTDQDLLIWQHTFTVVSGVPSSSVGTP